MVEAKDFTEDGILKTQIEREELFYRTSESNKEIYLAPHLLLKEVLGKNKFITKYLESDLRFKHRIFGIHSPKGQESELKNIENRLQSNYELYKLLILSSSAEAGISRSGGYTILKKDFINLPFPDEEDALNLSKNEDIIKNDVLKYKLEELSKGEKAKINISDASNIELKNFGEVFCNSLNAIYANKDAEFIPLNPISALSYICFPFYFGDNSSAPEISSKIQDGNLTELIENQEEVIHYRRILRLYQKDMVFLVKPKKLRYWLKSVALRDASDVIIDLVNSGY